MQKDHELEIRYLQCILHGAATLNSRKKVKAGLNCLIDIETGRKTEKDALGQFIVIL